MVASTYMKASKHDSTSQHSLLQPRATARSPRIPKRPETTDSMYVVRYEWSVPLEALFPLQAEAKRVEAEVAGHGAIQVGWGVHPWQPEATVCGMSLDGAAGSGSCAHVCVESLHGASHFSRTRESCSTKNGSDQLTGDAQVSSKFALECLACWLLCSMLCLRVDRSTAVEIPTILILPNLVTSRHTNVNRFVVPLFPARSESSMSYPLYSRTRTA